MSLYVQLRFRDMDVKLLNYAGDRRQEPYVDCEELGDRVRSSHWGLLIWSMKIQAE